MNDQKKNEMQELVNQELNTSDIFAVKKEDDNKSSSQAKKLVGQLHDAAVMETVKIDEDIQTKFKSQAKKSIETELDVIDQELKTREQVATYNANDEACKIYGINNAVPTWQIKLMRVGSGFWFIIYWVFATLTIAPINVFFKGIKAFIKNTYVVFIFALLSYLIIVVGIPILIKLLNG